MERREDLRARMRVGREAASDEVEDVEDVWVER
jgi:hypothetical protein